MRAAILTAYNEPMVIEEVTLAGHRPARRARAHRRQRRLPLRPELRQGNVPLPPPVILGHEGAGTVLAVGQRRHPRRGRATASSRRSSPRAATASSACATSRSLCETMGAHMVVPKGTRADGSAVIGA